MEIAFDQVAPYVAQKMKTDATAHDFAHIERVVNNVQAIITNESRADAIVALTAAYVHDLIDDKLVADPKAAIADLKRQLLSWHYSQAKVNQIIDIITHMSFSANLAHHYQLSIEGQIVQDADRLDAIGAIGIARAFYYGGHAGEPIYDPRIKPRSEMTKAQYRQPTTIVNHFYEKLLKIKNELNTATAKQMALTRQKYMEGFLTELKVEWGS